MAKGKNNTKKFLKAHDAAIEAFLHDVARKIESAAKELAPSESGKLRASIRADTKATVTDDEITVRVGAYSKYAASTEYGSAGRGQPATRSVPSAPPKKSTSITNSHPPEGWPNITPPGKRAYKPYYNSWYANTPKGKKFGGLHPGVYAQPFMRPAITRVIKMDNESDLKDKMRASMAKSKLDTK